MKNFLAALLLSISLISPLWAQVNNPQADQGQLTVNKGQLPGTATNDAAAAGKVGEVISCTQLTANAVSISSGTAANVLSAATSSCGANSISLTAGDWDVDGTIFFSTAATTTLNSMISSISPTSATLVTTPGSISVVTYGATGIVPGANNNTVSVGPTRVSVSATTPYFLVGLSLFTTSTTSVFGIITARRKR